MLFTPTLALAIGVDLIAISVLAGPLYFRRHRRRDLMLSYVALNVGVLGVAIALSGAQVGVGLGLGLFGVLSIVRLRSDQISQAEIAYYFTSLALGLLAGIGSASLWMPAAFSVVLLAVLYIVDHPRLLPAQRRQTLTLDRAYVNEHDLKQALATMLGATINHTEVICTDLVRDTTMVDVRYRIDTVSADTMGSTAPTPSPMATEIPPSTYAAATGANGAAVPVPVPVSATVPATMTPSTAPTFGSAAANSAAMNAPAANAAANGSAPNPTAASASGANAPAADAPAADGHMSLAPAPAPAWQPAPWRRASVAHMTGAQQQ